MNQSQLVDQITRGVVRELTGEGSIGVRSIDILSKNAREDLEKHLVSLGRRTKETWEIVRVYETSKYYRAVIESSSGKTRKIWYDGGRWRKS